MKDYLEKDNKEFPLICSICHKQKLDIKKNSSKLKKELNNTLKDIELSDLIIKCNCNNKKDLLINKNNRVYVHKFCILIKVLLHFEIKCEKCNAIYNIKIDKKIDKDKKVFLFSSFLIIYIIHLFIYLFCMLLLFINFILKENKFIKYKHLSYFFAIILLIINTIFLYFSVNKNIVKSKNIYKYSINIYDIININKEICSINNEEQFFQLLFEFYQWYYNQPIKNLLTIINKKLLINKINFYHNNSIENYIQKNSVDITIINKKMNNNKEISILKKKDQIKNSNSKELFLNNNKNDKNKNISFNHRQENNIYTKKINISKEEINLNRIENSNNNPINFSRKVSKNSISLNSPEDKYKLNHNDYINININPKTSKNININIHFNNEKSSLIDFSSSKEVNAQSNKKVNKFIRTAFIPKKLSMTNFISEANSFKRKRRILKSIKMRQNNSYLKNRGISGNIAEDEEVDFSEFDKMGSKISRFTRDKNTLLEKKDLDLKNSNFRSKRSYKDAEMDLSNSDLGPIEEINSNQNLNNTLKNQYSNKHVHFADS